MIRFEEAVIRAKIIKSMADPVRLMMIEFLKNGERSFSEVFDLFQLDKGSKDDRSAMELTYLKTKELMDELVKKHGTFICRKLLHGCELTTEEGQKYFKENELLKKMCAPCVESVAEILENINTMR